MRPRPQRGQGWREGGETAYPVWTFSRPKPIRPNIFRQFSFSSGKIRAYKLSPGFFLDFSDFIPKIFTISNFRAKNFSAKRISRPKKVRVSGFHSLRSGERFTTEKGVSCVTNTFFSNFRANFFFFFQLSTGNFFTIFKFRAEKKPAHKISNPKFLPGKNFRPCGWDVIGRIHFGMPAPASS